MKLLDELAILWVVAGCYWLWYPEYALPASYKYQINGRRKFSHFFIIFALIVSFMGFIQPVSIIVIQNFIKLSFLITRL